MPASTSMSESGLSDIAAKLRSDGVCVQDKSHNKLSVPVGNGSTLKETASGNYVNGSVTIPPASDLNGCLSGNNSFTVEANFIPTGNPQFNMIASKQAARGEAFPARERPMRLPAGSEKCTRWQAFTMQRTI